MHNFLILPVSVIPEWTKQNVHTFHLSRFSNDGQYLLLDDAHPESTYLRWLGPNSDRLPMILAAAVSVAMDEFQQFLADPQSVWYAASSAEGDE